MKKNNMKKKIKEKRFTEFEEMLIMVIVILYYGIQQKQI